MAGLVSLTVDAFATRRLVRLVVEDEVARPLREAVGSNPALDYLVHCQSCTSFWAAIVVAGLPRWARQALAASELAILATLAARALEMKALL